MENSVRLAFAATAFCVALASPGLPRAEEPVAEDALPDGGRTATPAPDADLEKLLRLPNSYSYSATGPEKKKGATQTEWHNRFSEARLELREAEEALAKAQVAMEQTSSDSGQWSMAAPGSQSSPENTPMSFKLRQEVRRQRETVDRAERKLRQLGIEADLAGVPSDWRQ